MYGVKTNYPLGLVLNRNNYFVEMDLKANSLKIEKELMIKIFD